MKRITKKISTLITGGLLTVGLVSGSYIDSYAATRNVKFSTPGSISAIIYGDVYTMKTQTPKAFVYMYNKNGNFVGKTELKVSKTVTGNFKVSSSNIKIDDKKVHQICLQVKNNVSTRYSARYGVKSATYKVSTNASGSCLYLSTK